LSCWLVKLRTGVHGYADVRWHLIQNCCIGWIPTLPFYIQNSLFTTRKSYTHWYKSAPHIYMSFCTSRTKWFFADFTPVVSYPLPYRTYPLRRVAIKYFVKVTRP
jgi:hypothetical protein